MKDRIKTLEEISGLSVGTRKKEGVNYFIFRYKGKNVKSTHSYPKAKCFAEGVKFGRVKAHQNRMDCKIDASIPFIPNQIIETTLSGIQELLVKKEAIVFMGCGGDLYEWIQGITKQTKDMVDPVKQWYSIKTTGGRIDLVMPLPINVDLGRLAVWKIGFGDCSWWSDYKINYKNQH